MAESQLGCMEDGSIGAQVSESRPEFYYCEEQRVAVEELLKNGDGAYKTRLKDDEARDFLSAREVKVLTHTFRRYDDRDGGGKGAAPTGAEQDPAFHDADSGVHSTYWPQMSDTEVPQLENGWHSGGMFKGVTRVNVHTHPPKDNGPHIKEVVRRLIQEAGKVIAIVMDVLTDLQILQDLMDAAWRRSVPVYILLDEQGAPHFLDMCQRLQIGSQHLRNIRARTLQGVGFSLSFGKLPGAVCAKYMLVDGDKVAFGSYSYAWCTSRMDRNMITVMTGQVVDFFDRDFRELYAISEKLNLYKEFHVSPPAAATVTRSRAESKRPALPATTSRFQVSLGDTQNPNIQVPAHKYYNPKYLLALGEVPRPSASLQNLGLSSGAGKAAVVDDMDLIRTRGASSEKMGQMSPLPSEAPSELFQTPGGVKKKGSRFKSMFRRKSSRKPSITSLANSTPPTPTQINRIDENEDNFEVIVRDPSKLKGKKASKMGQRTESQPSVNAAQDNESLQGHRQKGCSVS